MRILLVGEVTRLTGYSRNSLLRLEKAGTFPRRLKLGTSQGGKVGWLEEEIFAWIKSQRRAA